MLANSSWFGPGGSCLQWVGCDKHSHSQDPIWGQLGGAAACLMTGAPAVDVRQSARMVVRTARLISGDEHPTGCTWVPQACSWDPWRQCRGCRQAPRMFLGTSQPWIHFARGHQSSSPARPAPLLRANFAQHPHLCIVAFAAVDDLRCHVDGGTNPRFGRRVLLVLHSAQSAHVSVDVPLLLKCATSICVGA